MSVVVVVKKKKQEKRAGNLLEASASVERGNLILRFLVNERPSDRVVGLFLLI